MKSHTRAEVAGASARKPMTSPVYWAVLGLVMERPSYGYELGQRFERVYGRVLSLSNISQVYTALDVLKQRGFVEETASNPGTWSGTQRQPKVPYRATAEGRSAYREQLLARACEDRRQAHLFVRQLAAFEDEPHVAAEVLDRYEKECLREARQMPRASQGLADRLLSEESRMTMGGKLPWIEYARRVFSALERDGGDGAA
jgi:DNA-binding PadR family transcriptional regulator